MDVVIKGFTSQEQAEQFSDWYSGSGEQQFSDHLSFQDTTLKYANSKKTAVENGQYVITVKAVER